MLVEKQKFRPQVLTPPYSKLSQLINKSHFLDMFSVCSNYDLHDCFKFILGICQDLVYEGHYRVIRSQVLRT